MIIINDDFTSPDNLDTDINLSLADSQNGLDINSSLDGSPTDLNINLKSCEIAQLELVIVIGEPVIDSTKFIVIGEPVIDSPKLVMIPHHKIALQFDDQIAEIQTNYKKSALEIVKYSGSKSIYDLLGASIKNIDYQQYTEIRIWMEQNNQDGLENPDDLENPEINEEAAEVLTPENLLLQKVEKIISQMNQRLHEQFYQIHKKMNNLETKIDANDPQFNHKHSASSSRHSLGSSLSVTNSAVQKMIDTQMNTKYSQKLKLAELNLELAKIQSNLEMNRINESIELAKMELMREQKIELETDEKKRLNDIAEGKRQETEKQQLLNQQLQMENHLRPRLQNFIDSYSTRSKTLQISLKDFFARVSLKSTRKKGSKLPFIAHSLSTSASAVIVLIPLKWQGRLIAVSLIEAFSNWGASQLVRAYNSHQLAKMNESIYDRFITRLNTVVTAMEPWILDYPKSKSYIDSAGPSSTENNPERNLQLKFLTFSVVPFADLYMTGGTQLGTLLSIGRNDFGLHRNIELQTQLEIATRLCREFILQQSEDTEREKDKLRLNNESDIHNSIYLRLESLSAILAGQIPNANASNFLSNEELTKFKIAYNNYKKNLEKDY